MLVLLSAGSGSAPAADLRRLLCCYVSLLICVKERNLRTDVLLCARLRRQHTFLAQSGLALTGESFLCQMAAALLPTFGMEGRLSQRCHSWYTHSANKARRGRGRCERDERGARRRSDCCGSVRLGSRAGQARHAAGECSGLPSAVFGKLFSDSYVEFMLNVV